MNEPTIFSQMNDWQPYLDGEQAKIFLLGRRGVNCAKIFTMPGWIRADAVCLGNKSVHLFCGIPDDGKIGPEKAHADLRTLNAVILPPHRSDEPISDEALALFQEHGADLGIVAGDRTRDVVEKVVRVRGFPPLQLSPFAFM